EGWRGRGGWGAFPRAAGKRRAKAGGQGVPAVPTTLSGNPQPGPPQPVDPTGGRNHPPRAVSNRGPTATAQSRPTKKARTPVFSLAAGPRVRDNQTHVRHHQG